MDLSDIIQFLDDLDKKTKVGINKISWWDD